jgi:hypothetical protein
MSARDDLRRAVHTGDRTAIDRLGWTGFFDLLDRAWPKRLETEDRLAYATIVGHHDPKLVLETLQELARSGHAEWRPKPAQLAARLPKATNDGRTNAIPIADRPDRHPITLGRIRELVNGGATVCQCIGGRNYSQNAGGVLRCLTCGDLEQGQVDNAFDNPQEQAA